MCHDLALPVARWWWRDPVDTSVTDQDASGWRKIGYEELTLRQKDSRTISSGSLQMLGQQSVLCWPENDVGIPR
jgi:hypothetical protein